MVITPAANVGVVPQIMDTAARTVSSIHQQVYSATVNDDLGSRRGGT